MHPAKIVLYTADLEGSIYIVDLDEIDWAEEKTSIEGQIKLIGTHIMDFDSMFGPPTSQAEIDDATHELLAVG